MLTRSFNRLYDRIFNMHFKTRIILYVTLILILGGSVFALYKNYEHDLVKQQQQHMLSVSKSISRSIELFIDDIIDSVQVITLDKSFATAITLNPSKKEVTLYTDKLRSYLLAEGAQVYAAYLFDSKGKIIANYGAIDQGSTVLKSEVKIATARKSTYIGDEYMDPAKHSFILNIYEPIFNKEDFVGTLCVSIDLNVIYDRFIAPVQVGEKGYALVKNKEGIIIMHQIKEQVGIDVIKTRKMLHPDLDLKGLEELVNQQLTKKEGTYIYDSYWWAESGTGLKKAKKLNAFSPVLLDDDFWVVALTMSYEEIRSPMNTFLFGILLLTSFMALMAYFFMQALSKASKGKRELEQETQYLKILNETSERLRQQESELYHSQKLKMIGTLAGGISHDINNLLTPIYGYSELMLAQITPEHPFYEDIHEIYSASQKGKDMIEQLLLFSRKDQGMTSIDLIDINQVTEETIKLFRTMLPKGTRIDTQIDPDCGFVRANYTQLHQVIFNLCNNAYQATQSNEEEGKAPLIQIGLRTIPVAMLEDSNMEQADLTEVVSYNFVELSVKDNGCGMDDETLSRLFEPFYTTKERGDGTGLGLFVAKSIIDKYNGRITVESTQRMGSTFKVYFQIVEMDTEKRQSCGKIAIPLSVSSSEQLQPSSIHILIVDDHEAVVRMLEKGLTYYGYSVTCETDSVKALKRIRQNPEAFDVILTDYMMPAMTGLSLAKKAKRIRRDLGIVLMTGFMDEAKIDLAQNSALDACLLKPVEISNLSEKIITVHQLMQTNHKNLK